MSPTITPSMSIPEIISQYPQTKSVFEQLGIKADGYKALELEDLSASLRVHQLELEPVLNALNKAISNC